jgi:hypothetical protein
MTEVKPEHLNLSTPEFDDYDSTYAPNYTVSIPANSNLHTHCRENYKHHTIIKYAVWRTNMISPICIDFRPIADRMRMSETHTHHSCFTRIVLDRISQLGLFSRLQRDKFFTSQSICFLWHKCKLCYRLKRVLKATCVQMTHKRVTLNLWRQTSDASLAPSYIPDWLAI